MQGLNNPIGIKSLEPSRNPFITNPFRFASAGWDFEDDFTSYANTTEGDSAWATNNTGMVRVNPTDDDLDILFTTINLANYPFIYYDLTSVSDTAWVLRFKLNVAGFTTPGNYNFSAFFGLSSNIATNGFGVAQDGIFLEAKFPTGGTAQYFAKDVDGAVPFGSATDATFAHNVAVETIYVEIIRTSSTAYTIELFSDSAYTTSVEQETGTVASSTASLRYLKIGIADNSGHATGDFTATVDDVFFADGVTDAP